MAMVCTWMTMRATTIGKVLPGTGFTIEPGLYFDSFGVRTEINVFYGEREALITGPVQTEIVRLT